jgi:hypothetical protein
MWTISVNFPLATLTQQVVWTCCWQYYQDYNRTAVTGARILARETNFYLLQNVQTGSRAHPVCCLMVTEVLYRGQSGQSVNSTTYIHLTPSRCGRRNLCVTSVFRHEVAENRALLGHYAASGGNSLPTIRDNLSVPSSGFKNPKNPDSWTLRMGRIGCSETSVRNNHYLLRDDPEERSSLLGKIFLSGNTW